MEPISAALLALASVKKAINIGKDLSSVSSDLNKVFSFIDGAKEAQKSGNKNDPLAELTLYYKALDMEKTIEEAVWQARGSSGVRMLKQFREKAKEREKEGRYQATKRKNQIINAIGWVVSICITGGGGYLMYLFAMKYK
tara:strand:+ start:384 stop:803 length:420 start_codon:yes stop_codon:yes gene_type:complete